MQASSQTWRSEGVKIYEFLREPLIRRFGEEWYNEVCEAAKLLEEETPRVESLETGPITLQPGKILYMLIHI